MFFNIFEVVPRHVNIKEKRTYETAIRTVEFRYIYEGSLYICETHLILEARKRNNPEDNMKFLESYDI